MARGRVGAADAGVEDYRYPEARRKNNPPAGLAAQGRVREQPKVRYAYDPHRPPELRFDATGQADHLPALLQTARTRALSADEAQTLADALRVYEPWLEWAGKREQAGFAVDPVALNIHERVSARAIVEVAKREDVQRTLFADPEQSFREAVQFYQHDVAWANRLILGDSLAVMSSLAKREDLAGKVQMIYMDPPYGIKFASNFQSQVGQRDVKDRPDDLTREPETIKAYRDTWNLGVHSYLAYLRDRLYVAKDLLADSGSIFVQIGDENVHRVRAVLDEVFEAENFISLICVKKTGGQSSSGLAGICDYLLWYSKDGSRLKYRQLYFWKKPGDEGAKQYNWFETLQGQRRPFSGPEHQQLPSGSRILQPYPLVSMGPSSTDRPFHWRGRDYRPSPNRHWSTTGEGLGRLATAERLLAIGDTLRSVNYLGDYPVAPITNLWTDTQTSGFAADRMYVVQTLPMVIERCMLMTTDPGDLVLDPTCGSGTTAYVAEQWGRRWITIDTSRVALAIARQRLLTASFPYYALTDEQAGVAGGLRSKTVPHITLKSIAQNPAIDAVAAKHADELARLLDALNMAVRAVSPEVRTALQAKLLQQERTQGKSSITDADRRRWLLPKDRWQEWEVPFDTDPDWPRPLQEALTAYRAAWRQKMDAIDAAIAANAEQEELVDQPEVVRGVTRVSGPFTVESVLPAEASLDEASPIDGPDGELDGFGDGGTAASDGRPAGAEEGPRAPNSGGPDERRSPMAKAGVKSMDAAAPGPPISPWPSDVRQAPQNWGRGGLPQHQPGAQPPDLAVPVASAADPLNAAAYLDRMLRLLRADGVRFPNNRHATFLRLDPLEGGVLHAEGEWAGEDGRPRRVAVAFGPQYGPVTAPQVEACMRAARVGYDDLVFAGFSFDAEAQATIEEVRLPGLTPHLAHIRPDVTMGDLLKQTPNSQLFTVFGSPRTRLEPAGDGEWLVHMEGVDVYDPVSNTVASTGESKVAAWFLDSDYDDRTFCICQAFFPDKSAWEKLARALKGAVDADAFARLSGTTSLPFRAGKRAKVAIKVIDPRGNEVMCVHSLRPEEAYA